MRRARRPRRSGGGEPDAGPGAEFHRRLERSLPIQADRLDDAEVGRGRAAIAFFGAAHCWNTNREAERLVALYPRFRDRVHFVIVDVDHPSDAQRALVAVHYHGYIPTLVVFGADGGIVYERSGETAHDRGDTSALAALLEKAVGH